MARESKNALKASGPVGGIPFFITLISLVFICAVSFIYLPLIFDDVALLRWTQFLAGCLVGFWSSVTFIRGSFSVFIHELKHSIVSNLAGNKAKGMKVEKDSGHFEYEYTKDTAKFNALIALAPYWFPLFTLPLLPVCWFFFAEAHVALILVGMGVGLDLHQNSKDVSEHQSDISGITGGYKVGLLFIVAMNVCMLSILGAWVSQGSYGLKYLFAACWNSIAGIVGLFWRK